MTNENNPTPREDPHFGASRESGEEQVDELIQEESDQGFRGVETDPTPNENYTLEGVSKGAPTPENSRVVNRPIPAAPANAAPFARPAEAAGGRPRPGVERPSNLDKPKDK